MKVIGLCGSLRRQSYNHKLLREAIRLSPDTMDVNLYEISDLPMINVDLEEGGFPPPVERLMDAVAGADAVLLVSPEYNGSLSPVLKNAIDWLSRAPKNRVLSEKPAALMGASTGYLGTSRMQGELRAVLTKLNMHPLNQPVFILPQSREQFDEDGRLSDPQKAERVTRLMEALEQWVLRLKRQD